MTATEREARVIASALYPHHRVEPRSEDDGSGGTRTRVWLIPTDGSGVRSTTGYSPDPEHEGAWQRALRALRREEADAARRGQRP